MDVSQTIRIIERHMLVDKGTKLLAKHGYNAIGLRKSKAKKKQLLFESRLMRKSISL